MNRDYRSALRVRVLLGAIIALAAASTPAWATTLQEEIDLGKKLDQQILKETPLSTDADSLKEIDGYGQRLVKGASIRRPQIQYHFRIIQEDDFNAFSTPGGYVYFSQRLWDVLRPEERIGVLAHEMTHVDRRHALDAMSKAQRRQIWLAVLLTAVKANQAVGDIADMAHQLYTLKYLRGDEQQADEVGMQLTKEAGYNPAGLLLAMRKIGRFQSEQGGEPPKIFASHPPTPERLAYLEADLKKMGVPVPSEGVKDIVNPYKVGEVTAASGGTVDFTSSKPLKNGAGVWVMKTGWDTHYENRTAVPAARGVVTTTGSGYRAQTVLIPGANPKAVAKGAGIYLPPEPKPEHGIARFEAASAAATPKLAPSSALKKLDRLMAQQVVWNKDDTQLIYDNAAYVVVRDPSNPTGYVSAGRPKYSYAPIGPGVELERIADADAGRWAGIVASIGRGGETLELLPAASAEQLARDQKDGKRFDVCHPPWDPKQTYKNRIVGTASIASLGGKIVLQVTGYSPGWDIDAFEVGFDIYETAKDRTNDSSSNKND